MVYQLLKERSRKMMYSNTDAMPSPYVNYLNPQRKRSAQRKLLKRAKKSEFYRKELEKLIGQEVTLECKNWFLFNTSSKRKPYDEILLTNVVVKKIPTSLGVQASEIQPIEHMWVRVDEGWKKRNPFKINDTLVLRGLLSEYLNTRRKLKNIGMDVNLMWIAN